MAGGDGAGSGRGGDTEDGVEEASHLPERGFCRGDGALLLGRRKCDRIERGGEGPPVQPPPRGSGGEVACAEGLTEAKPRCGLQQERRAEIRALRDIEPAERGGDVRRCPRGERWRRPPPAAAPR